MDQGQRVVLVLRRHTPRYRYVLLFPVFFSSFSKVTVAGTRSQTRSLASSGRTMLKRPSPTSSYGNPLVRSIYSIIGCSEFIFVRRYYSVRGGCCDHAGGEARSYARVSHSRVGCAAYTSVQCRFTASSTHKVDPVNTAPVNDANILLEERCGPNLCSLLYQKDAFMVVLFETVES